MEDTRDKRPVYMSTFQKRTDKIKAEIKSELEELDFKINMINRQIIGFVILITILIVGVVVYCNYNV